MQITSGYTVVADEVFDSSREAERFVTWWFAQRDLPMGGAMQARADLADVKWTQPDGLLSVALVPDVRDRFEGEDDGDPNEPADNPRERDEDDGLTYADPQDEKEARRLAAEEAERRFDELTGWMLGPRPE